MQLGNNVVFYKRFKGFKELVAAFQYSDDQSDTT